MARVEGNAVEKEFGFWRRIAPALTLMFLAPMIAEVLPGATRVSSIFVLPIEMLVWGGGALLSRGLVRKFGLSWVALLFLGFALAIAEECIIQQSSLAPPVIAVKGHDYARALGVNWVYFLWALGYESLLVVVVPVALTELIFPSRRERTWLSLAGTGVVTVLFGIGSFIAWFLWTHIVRIKVFHVGAYTPPMEAIAIAAGAILLLIVCAISSRRSAPKGAGWAPPPPIVLWFLALLPPVAWYWLVLLGFGVDPTFPIPLAVAEAVVVPAIMLAVLPRWASHQNWRTGHTYAAVSGTIIGAMGVGFVGFYASPLDFWGKIALDAIATVLLVWLGFAAPWRAKA